MYIYTATKHIHSEKRADYSAINQRVTAMIKIIIKMRQGENSANDDKEITILDTSKCESSVNLYCNSTTKSC